MYDLSSLWIDNYIEDVVCDRSSIEPVSLTKLRAVNPHMWFEDTKGVIRTRKSKKNRQHSGQKKKDKKTNNDLQNIHIKPKIE